MMDFRKLAFVGLVSLGLAAVGSAGCSSSGGTGTGGSTGTGGTGTGTGGTSSHTGGSTGTGGTGTGTGGAAGGAAACAAAPTSGLIADFMGDAGIEIMGGVTTYPNGSNSKPSFTIGSNMLNVTENFASTSAAQYVGTVLYFNTCIDASAFAGIEFDWSGSFAGCTVQYSANDAPHDDMTSDPKGTCTLGAGMCYSPQAGITSATTTVQSIKQPWITTAGGSPSVVLDPKQLTGIQWQFTIPAATDGGANTCMANLNIANVKFYH
jgi:hypothetical protein